MKNGILVSCIIIGLGIAYSVYGIFGLSIPFQGIEGRTFSIEPGDRIQNIAQRMVSFGIARDVFITELYLRALGSSATIKAGEYEIQPGTTGFAAGLLFLQGVPKKELTLRIIEGWNVAQIAQYLKNEGLQSTDIIKQNTLEDWNGQFPVFKGMRVSLEGFYFPDTYRVFAGARAEDITQKALTNFEKKVMSLFPSPTPIEKIYETITLASIIEKEVATDADRALVADIFYRRMRMGMPLQSDATVNYVTGGNALQATLSDTQIDSPYNTYRVKGLPPGPICNPGLSSIQAVLHPQENGYLFFLTTRDEKVIYSKTFEEHVRNKQKYLQ